MGRLVRISSLDRVCERVLDHLRQGHHTALIGSPGCGMTTFLTELSARIVANDFIVSRYDRHQLRNLSELTRQLAERGANTARHVLVLDHIGVLPPEDFRRFLTLTAENAGRSGDLCLWCGNLDVRAADRQLGIKLCSVPSAHVSFPMLTRDELLAAYVAIAEKKGCRWGDAVLYLMLDLCGSDLALVTSATDFLPGDWSNRIYDEAVWDRIQDWLNSDEKVDNYRARLRALPDSCETTLALIRFGGKPQCLRAELIEEIDDGLRRLCLDGFIIPNLLPGFYQLRNLVVRFLLDESVQPELHFRRATNERAATLLQDIETMLRQVLASVFTRMGVDSARKRLEAMQQPGEVVDANLHRVILKWSHDTCSEEGQQSLSKLISEHRDAFKNKNSVWNSNMAVMQRDGIADNGEPHVKCIEYLTFDQLGQLVIALKDDLFPHLNDSLAKTKRREPRFRCASDPMALVGNWRADVARIRRLRNQVAHLRNVGFQDMEDLTRMVERMRTDVILYGGVITPGVAISESGDS